MLDVKQFNTKQLKVQYLTCLTRVPHPVCEQVVVYERSSAWFLLAVHSGSSYYLGTLTDGSLSLSDP